jgi:hypothetical protein
MRGSRWYLIVFVVALAAGIALMAYGRHHARAAAAKNCATPAAPAPAATPPPNVPGFTVQTACGSDPAPRR